MITINSSDHRLCSESENLHFKQHIEPVSVLHTMGRFRIHDPSLLAQVGKDKSYARCLECNKKLKNIMGNIKRHYAQLHSKESDGPTKRPKKLGHNIKITDDGSKNVKKKRGRPKKVCTTDSEAGDDSITDNSQNATTTSGARQSNRVFEQIHKIKFNSSQANEEQQQEDDTMETQEHETKPPKAKKLKAMIKPQNIVESNLLPTEEQLLSSPFQQIKKLQIVSLNMDRQEYLQCIAKTVTEFNMPLRYFDDEKVFQKLLQPWTKAYGIQFNSKTIIEHITNMATNLRADITKSVGHRFICLKLDIVCRADCSIMIVNIQFIKDFELKVYTIGVFELLDDHFATYLKQQILNTLERYHIDISKVYSITKDNGSNVKKSLKILQEFKENGISDDDENIICLDDANANESTQNLSEHFVGHSLHLVACNVLKLLNENISQSRDAVKKLRRKMVQLNINPLPILDNNSRWSSTYDMMKSLLSTRQYVEDNKQLKVEIDWEFARKFEESFKPIVDTISMLQSNQLIIGDFFREWLVCESELEELSDRNELAMLLLDAMHDQKKTLMENETFAAALYLDPRFCYRGSIYLEEKQKKIAIFHLLIIFNKLKSSMENTEKDDESSTCPKIVVFTGNERYVQLEKKANEQMEMLNKVKTEPRSFSDNSKASLTEVDCSWVKESLEQLQYAEKLTFNTNILYYWKTKSYSNSILAKIAEIVLAVPATQVTIKRAFSALPVVLTKQKKNLNSENLESILLLKLNPELVKNITFD